MAEYQLTRDEYEHLLDRPPSVRSPWVRLLLRITLLVLGLVLVVLVIYFGQWLFGALALVFVVFTFMVSRRWNREGFEKDAFKAGRVQVDILPDTIKIQAGSTQVQFPYSDLSNLLEYPRCFLVRHHSGLQVTLPRTALTEQEVSILVNLQRSLPAIAKRMYTA